MEVQMEKYTKLNVENGFFDIVSMNHYEEAYLLIADDIENYLNNEFKKLVENEIDFSLLSFIDYLIREQKISFDIALHIKSKLICQTWRDELEGFQQYLVWDELNYIEYYNSEVEIMKFLTYILEMEDDQINMYYTKDYIDMLQTILIKCDKKISMTF